MKKLTKVMLSVAAAFVMTAAVAVTAMAVDTISGTYDNTTGLVTMDGVELSGKSQTILVYDNNVAQGEEPVIKYINQIDNDGKFSTFYLESGLQSTAPVTYNIKIGGTDKSIQTGTLTIVKNTVTIIIGDVDGNGKVNMSDVTKLGRKATKKADGYGNAGNTRTKPNGDTIIIGDVDGNNKVNMSDVTKLGRKATKKSDGYGNAGQEVEVLAETPAAN